MSLLNKKKISWGVLAIVLSAPFGSLYSQGVDSVAFKFVKKCASCHTIGVADSDLDGPDLQEALGYSDDDLQGSFDSMEEEISEKLSAEFRTELIAFFRSENLLTRLKTATEASENSFGEGLAPGAVDEGRALYNGTKRFENNGVSCMSCHDSFDANALGGGALGPSLEKLSEKMGKAKLFNAIKNSKYKVMRNIYNSHSITDQEAVHLVTYFEEIKEKPAESGVGKFVAIGVLIGICLIGVFGFIYRNRISDLKEI